VKNFLKKIWEKIKSLFKRFMMIIDSYTKNDKDFLNKYRKELGRVTNLTDFEFKGYKWNDTAFNNTKTVIENDLQSTSKDWRAAAGAADSETDYDKDNENADDAADKYRGTIIQKLGGQNGTYNSSEFSKELKELYRSGDSEKQTLDAKDIGGVHKIITELSTSKDIKKGVADAFKASKKSIENDEKYVDRELNTHLKTGLTDDQNPVTSGSYLGKQHASNTYADFTALKAAANKDSRLKREVEKIDDYWEKNATGTPAKIGSDDETTWKNKKAAEIKERIPDDTMTKSGAAERATKSYGRSLREIRLLKDILIQVDTAYLAAWKDRSRQNKAIAIKMVYHKPKNEEAYNESYTGSYTGDNFLANIQLK